MRGRWFGAVVVTALLVLVTACARPVGTLLRPSPTPSPSPVVQHAPLIVTAAPFHAGEVGVPYAPVTLTATGGVAPYRWAVPFGALPDGLALAGDTVSGSPTASGTFSFGVQVFDSDSDTAGVPVSVGIVARLTAGLVSACATECTVELGCVSVCGIFGHVSGGLPPLSYTRSGALPAGTTLSGLTLNGTFIGLPGRLQFTVQVTDGFGVTTSLSPTFNMLTHISLAGGSCLGNYITGCSVQLPITGGTPGGTPAVQVSNVSCSPNSCPGPPGPPRNTLPAGFSATATSAYVTVTFPNRLGYGWYGSFVLTLTDQNTCGAGPSMCSSAGATVLVNVVAG